MKLVFKLLRVKQWVKNLFLFIPVFFAGRMYDFDLLLHTFYGFIAFSLAASCVYILNDLKDVKADRIHPSKKKRPIASGQISSSAAIAIMVVLFFIACALAYFVDLKFFYLVVLYLGINIAYTFKLKQIAILDLFLVASGFLIRVMSGGYIGNLYVSNWLMIMVLLLALFLVTAKRRDDLILSKLMGTEVRKASANYNLVFINACMTMLSAVIIVAYISYTLSAEVITRIGNDNLWYTSIFVIGGVMRYMQISMVEEDSGSPTKVLLKDKFIHFTLVLWAMAFFVILYS